MVLPAVARARGCGIPLSEAVVQAPRATFVRISIQFTKLSRTYSVVAPNWLDSVDDIQYRGYLHHSFGAPRAFFVDCLGCFGQLREGCFGAFSDESQVYGP